MSDGIVRSVLEQVLEELKLLRGDMFWSGHKQQECRNAIGRIKELQGLLATLRKEPQ